MKARTQPTLEQLFPGAIGEAATQFCVLVNCPLTATEAIFKGAVPVLVTVTLWGADVVLTVWLPNVRLVGP